MALKKIKRVLSNILKKFDLFPTNQFVKYKKQSQFTTATGGLVSLGLIIIVLILFSSKGIQTANRSIISSTVTYSVEAEPSPIDVITDTSNGFMFAVGVYGLNLNLPNTTYFNVTLTQQYYSPVFQLINESAIPLEQCTSAHFNFNQEILTMYYKFNLSQSLCPPLGHKFEVGGRVTSSILKRFTLYVNKCNTTLNSKCLDSTAMDAVQKALGGQFTLVTPVVNTIVNPNSQSYLQTFIEDRNYFTFTPTLGMKAHAFIQQYSIQTDISILPNTVKKIQQINTIPELFTAQSAMVNGNNYVTISFSKSNRSTAYTRAFNKIDQFFSYVGGLIGSTLAAFFLLKSYSEKAFLIDLASNILESPKPEYSFKSYNLIYSMGVSLKRVLQIFSVKFSWGRVDYFIKSIQQMDEQLDICLIIKKLTFLEEAVSTILSEHQIETLYLKGKISLEEIEQLRKKHHLSVLLTKEQRNQTDIELLSDQVFNSQLADPHEKEAIDKIKTNLVKIVKESKHKNKISARILKKLKKEKIEKMGIIEDSIKQHKSQNLQVPQQNHENKKEQSQQANQIQVHNISNEQGFAFELVDT